MNITELENILCKGMDGKIPLDEVTRLLSTDLTLSANEQNVIHMLVHFITDHDLRINNIEYEQLLREQIDASFKKLKQVGTGS